MIDKNKVGFTIRKFWTNYTPDGKGGVRAVDMVAYGPVGSQNITVDAVSRLAKVQPYESGSENIAALMANERWKVIGQGYEAWKRGHEMPVNGIPLGAWPGISTEQADELRRTGIRTVEEVADLSDSVLTRVNLPGMRDLKAMAAAYLKAAERTAVSTDLAKKDAEIAEMREQLEEMKKLMLEQMARDDEAPKRRGRPPKADAEPMEADAA